MTVFVVSAVYSKWLYRDGDCTQCHETVVTDAGGLPSAGPECYTATVQSHTALPEHLQRETL